MIEQPQHGYTGVVWEAREPDRLARELTIGPGAVPMAETGAAWGRLATTFGAAVIEYEQIVESLREAWQSKASGPVLASISRLRDWLTDTANSAAANAGRAETQAAAYEVARLAMPNAGDLASIRAVQQTLEQVGAALGAPLRAIAASTHEDADLAKATAARVMRTYEGATEPLAEPWQQDQPPVLTSATALQAEQGVAAGHAEAAASARMPLVAMPAMPGPVVVPRVRTAYRTRVFVAAETVEAAKTTIPQGVPSSTGTQLPVVAGPTAATASGATQEQGREARAGYAEPDVLGADVGITAAPAVLGAAEQPPAGRATATGSGA
ncbi:PPE domain-containing protein [Nocardia beijingensis]|uniref:PPE domain-containing protein n=1 Tax=Nocardia beijingensis TaxID=95162 RepID=UPI00332343C6